MSSVRRPTSRAAIRVYSLTVQRTARGGRGSRLRLAISIILAPEQADLAAQLLEHHVVARGDRRLALTDTDKLLLAQRVVFLGGESLGVLQQRVGGVLVQLVDQVVQLVFHAHRWSFVGWSGVAPGARSRGSPRVRAWGWTRISGRGLIVPSGPPINGGRAGPWARR